MLELNDLREESRLTNTKQTDSWPRPKFSAKKQLLGLRLGRDRDSRREGRVGVRLEIVYEFNDLRILQRRVLLSVWGSWDTMNGEDGAGVWTG